MADRLFRFGFLELTKPPANPKIAAWQQFFTTGQVANDAPKYLREAATIIDEQHLTWEERDMINTIEKGAAIRSAELNYAYNQGKTRGIAIGETRGIAEESRRIARSMLQADMDTNLIQALTNLSEDEIERLRR